VLLYRRGGVCCTGIDRDSPQITRVHSGDTTPARGCRSPRGHPGRRRLRH
jgi:hypothetical protein